MNKISNLDISIKDLTYPAENHELLCIILDLSPLWWSRTSESSILGFIDSIVAFSVVYLSFSTKKELSIIGVVSEKSEYIYTHDDYTNNNDNGENINAADCKVRLFQILDSTIRRNIVRLLSQSGSMMSNSVNMSGALIKSLCYYNQRQKHHRVLSSSLLTPLSGRFVVVRTSVPDSSCCFMSMMNGIFTAQKLNICIDVCLLDDASSATPMTSQMNDDTTNILRQSADMTNGIYLKINKLAHLYQNLVTLFLPDKDDRTYMTIISKTTNIDTDFRASCFCHSKLISMGYVCSLCLAVFCRYSPICRCCLTLSHDNKLKLNNEL